MFLKLLFVWGLAVFFYPFVVFAVPLSQAVITLPQALSLVLTYNPELAGDSLAVLAKDGQVIQARRWSNPEIFVEIENLREREAQEIAYGLSHTLEMGWKRSKRVQIAKFERDLAQYDFQARRLDVLATTEQAFYDALIAQEHLRLADDFLRLSEDVLRVVTKKVQVGQVSPLEQSKAEIELAKARLEQAMAQTEWFNAKVELGRLWLNAQDFSEVVGDAEMVVVLPPLDSLIQRVSHNPDAARWQTEVNLTQKMLSLTKAERLPDLTLSGGVRQLKETDTSEYFAGVSLPLPLFNLNGGNIRTARYEQVRADKQRQAALVGFETATSQTYQAVESASRQVIILKTEVLPTAQTVFNAHREGYNQGKFSYLEMLDAQRTLFEVKRQYLDTLTDYHAARITLQRLTPSE